MTRMTCWMMMLGLTLLAVGPARGQDTGEDPGVLWIEDGLDLKTGPKPTDGQWAIDSIEHLGPADGGGVVLRGVTGKSVVGTYCPVDAQHPWLVWEVSQVKPVGEGFRSFSGPRLAAGGQELACGIGQITHLQPGLFTQNMAQIAGDRLDEAAGAYLRMDLNNAEVVLSRIAIVQEPANYIEVLSPAFEAKQKLEIGDELTVRVVLAEPAEHVQVRLFNGYTMPEAKINGQHTIDLEPEDGQEPSRVWSATFQVDGGSGGRVKDAAVGYPRGQLLFKATAFGNPLGQPIWTCNPVPFVIAEATSF